MSEVRTERLANGHYSYRLVTREPSGALRPRIFKAQAALPLEIGHRVSLLWDGARMVGIGEEATRLWSVIQPSAPTNLGLMRLINYLTLVCLAVCVLLSVRWVLSLQHTQASVWLWVGALCALSALAPLATRVATKRKPKELKQVDTLAEIGGDAPRSGRAPRS